MAPPVLARPRTVTAAGLLLVVATVPSLAGAPIGVGRVPCGLIICAAVPVAAWRVLRRNRPSPVVAWVVSGGWAALAVAILAALALDTSTTAGPVSGWLWFSVAGVLLPVAASILLVTAPASAYFRAAAGRMRGPGLKL